MNIPNESCGAPIARASTGATASACTLTLILASAALLLPTPTAAQTASVQEFQVDGIHVLYKPIEANDVIAVQLYLKGGSAALTPATAGIERFIGEVAGAGTEKYDKAEFASRAAAAGARLGGTSTNDYTVATLQAVKDHWDESWDLFTQAVLHPTFPDAEVELARQQILNQLRGRQDSPDAYLTLLGDEALYEGHPYAIDPQGTVAAIEALGRGQLEDWHRERLTKENLLLVVVGNVTRADLEAKVRDAFGTLPDTGGAVPAAAAVDPGSSDLRVVQRELPTNYVLGRFAAPSFSDPDFPALSLGVAILRNRLFEEVRTKRNLSYAVSSFLGNRGANFGGLYVTAVEPDTTLKVMFHEVERLKSEPIPERTLDEQINVFLTGYWLDQETNQAQATVLALAELFAGGWENLDGFVERVREVQPEDIERAASRYIRNLHFVVIGDPAKIDRGLFTSM